MTTTRCLFYAAIMLNTLLQSLTHLAEPIGFVWLCLWVAAVRLWIKKVRGVAVFLTLIALFMSIVGSTRVPGDLVASLELPFVVPNLDKLPACDTAVVLGGGVRPSKFDVAGSDLTASSDRVVMGMEMVRRGKARTLVVGGAAQTVNGRRYLEADLTKQWLATLGWTRAPVISLGACVNTHDEAVRVAALCKEKGWQKILLVTSGYHMKRAQAAFKTAGVPVVCVPCDFQTEVSIQTETRILLVPQIKGFEKMTLYVHEQIGWFVYRWRGWIKV